MFLDRFNGNGAALGFANHCNQTRLGEHHLGKFIHAGGSGGASRANGFIAHRIDGANVINNAIFKTHRKRFAFGEHVLNAFMRSVPPGEDFSIEK